MAGRCPRCREATWTRAGRFGSATPTTSRRRCRCGHNSGQDEDARMDSDEGRRGSRRGSSRSSPHADPSVSRRERCAGRCESLLHARTLVARRGVQAKLSARSPTRCCVLPLLLTLSGVLRHRRRRCGGVAVAAVAAIDSFGTRGALCCTGRVALPLARCTRSLPLLPRSRGRRLGPPRRVRAPRSARGTRAAA